MARPERPRPPPPVQGHSSRCLQTNFHNRRPQWRHAIVGAGCDIFGGPCSFGRGKTRAIYVPGPKGFKLVLIANRNPTGWFPFSFCANNPQRYPEYSSHSQMASRTPIHYRQGFYWIYNRYIANIQREGSWLVPLVRCFRFGSLFLARIYVAAPERCLQGYKARLCDLPLRRRGKRS